MTKRVATWAAASGTGVAVAVGAGAPWWLVAIAHGLSAWGVWRLWPREAGAGEAVRAGAIAAALPVAGGLGAWWLAREEASPTGAVRERMALEPLPAPAPAHWPAPAPTAVDEAWTLAAAVADGDMETKLTAAAALGALEDPAAVRALRSLLTHPDAQARLVASLELQKREERLVTALQAARAEQEAAPGAAGALAVAQAARHYAESGLSAGSAAEALWQEAESAARLAIAQGDATVNAEGYVELARALCGLGDARAALDAAEAACHLAPTRWEAAHARCLALHAMGAFDRLRQAAAELARLAPRDSRIHESALYWG